MNQSTIYTFFVKQKYAAKAMYEDREISDNWKKNLSE